MKQMTTDLLPGEKNRDYIERVFTYLFENQLISSAEIERLEAEEHRDYRLTNFGFSRPLFVESSIRRMDSNSYPRYYANPICGRYHLCKEWYFDEGHPSFNFDKLQKWVDRMMRKAV